MVAAALSGAGVAGTKISAQIVRSMGIRSSRLVTEEGTEIIMPNADLLSGEVINRTVRNNQVRVATGP